jgi:hypothetical protein
MDSSSNNTFSTLAAARTEQAWFSSLFLPPSPAHGELGVMLQRYLEQEKWEESWTAGYGKDV